MEFCCGNDFCQFFHVDRFDVDNICWGTEYQKLPQNDGNKRTETLVTDVEVPEVDAEIIGRDVRFTVGVDGDGVDVISMGVGIDLAGDGGNDLVLCLHPRKAEVGSGGGWR